MSAPSFFFSAVNVRADATSGLSVIDGRRSIERLAAQISAGAHGLIDKDREVAIDAGGLTAR